MSSAQTAALVRAYTDITGAADYVDTTPRHIKELVYRRQIPYYKVGRLVRFSFADLDAWMATNRVEVG